MFLSFACLARARNPEFRWRTSGRTGILRAAATRENDRARDATKRRDETDCKTGVSCRYSDVFGGYRAGWCGFEGGVGWRGRRHDTARHEDHDGELAAVQGIHVRRTERLIPGRVLLEDAARYRNGRRPDNYSPAAEGLS